MTGEAYYQARGQGSFRGRGKGNRGGGRGGETTNQNCFGCGEPGHWRRECSKRDNVCTKCGGKGHAETTCYDKINGVARGGKVGGSRMRGHGRGTRGIGRGGYAKFGEVEEEQGHAETLFAEINLGDGDGDGEEAEWVCDSGASHHMMHHIMHRRLRICPVSRTLSYPLYRETTCATLQHVLAFVCKWWRNYHICTRSCMGRHYYSTLPRRLPFKYKEYPSC